MRTIIKYLTQISNITFQKQLFEYYFYYFFRALVSLLNYNIILTRHKNYKENNINVYKFFIFSSKKAIYFNYINASKIVFFLVLLNTMF